MSKILKDTTDRIHPIGAKQVYEDRFTEKPIDISKLTLDEQADLIIKKLSTVPKPKRTTKDEIMEIMSKAIAEEIDKEILEKLKKGL
jgi:hypothetical protein